MSAAARFLWRLAGQPSCGRKTVAVPDGAVCLCCGGDFVEGQAAAAKDALGINYDFTQARRPDSALVCVPCAWSLAGRGLATLRLWTVAAAEDTELPASHPKCAMQLGFHVHLTNRADMRTVAAMLTDPPAGEWLVTAAVSGQKHVVPYATTNRGGGPWRVRVETCDVTGSPGEMAMLLGRVAALRRAGFGPGQIAALDPGTSLSSRARLVAWRQHADPITCYRGSPLLGLAALIPTKEHLDEYVDRYTARLVEPTAV